MQTSAVAARITTASQLNHRLAAKPVITVRDLRLRGFSRCVTGGLTYTGDVASVTNVAGEIVRARILQDGTLDIRYATPAASMTWSSNTVTATSKGGWGVALYASGDTLDVFYIHTDGVTVKTRRSTDGGHTWGSASDVTTLSAQPTTPNALVVFFAAPEQNMLFSGDNSAGALQMKVSIYSGGSWSTQTWDLGSIAATGPANIYGAGQYHVPFSVVKLATNDYLIALFARAPRGYTNDGIYTVRVTNLGAGLTPHWQQLEMIHATNPGNARVGEVTYPSLFVGFPKLRVVGSESWLIALESSGFAGHNVQHLCFFRSPNGIDWTDRQYLAGTDFNYSAGGTPTAYAVIDMLNASVVVSGNYFYIVGFDKVFRTDATMLCGVDNSAKKLDISADVLTPIAPSMPDGGQAAVLSLTITNSDGTYNGFDGLTAILRKGAQVTLATGYYTTSGEETITELTLLIDEIEQTTAVNKDSGEIINVLRVTLRDYAKRIKRDTGAPDIFYEFNSPAHTNLPALNDLTSFAVYNGQFSAAGGELMGGLIDATDKTPDNMAVLSHLRAVDGFAEIAFKCLGGWTNSYVGIVLQIKDNTQYLAVVYDGANFSLYNATPNAAGAATTHSYALVTNIGGQTRQTAASLTVGTLYYLKVAQWHNRVVAWYSSNRTTWTKVIDYAPVDTQLTYWGIVQKGRVTASAPRGENHQPADLGLDSTNYSFFLNDIAVANLGKAVSVFLRVKTAQGGKLRSITSALSRWEGSTNLAYVPDITVEVWKDYGDGTKPASLSDTGNRLYTITISPTQVELQIANRVSWLTLPVNSDVSVDAETYYWICVKAAANMSTTGGGYELPATPMSILYTPASHAGHVSGKALFQYNPADLTSFYDFAPENGGLGSMPSAFLLTSYDASGIVIQKMQHCAGDPPRTIEQIARAIATKAGVLSYSLEDWINDAFGSFDNGADGGAYNWASNYSGVWAVGSGQLSGYHASASTWALLRTNTYLGSRGDGIIDVDMTILAASKRAGVLLRASGTPSSLTYGYLVDVSTESPPMVRLSKIVAGTITLLYSFPSLVAIPTNAQFHLTVVSNAGMVAIYINRNLAAAFWDTAITGQGAIGVACYENVSGGAVAQFDNLRVPGVWKLKDYFAIEAKSGWEENLQRLLGKNRIYYDFRYDGSFRLSSFMRRSSVATYSATLVEATKTDSDHYWASHLQPEGERFADRFDGELIDSDGRRFRAEDYTDAFTDEQAWDDAGVPLRSMRERGLQYTVKLPCDPALEREDVITITNPLDGTTSGVFVVNDKRGNYALVGENGFEFDMYLGLRSFVE